MWYYVVLKLNTTIYVGLKINKQNQNNNNNNNNNNNSNKIKEKGKRKLKKSGRGMVVILLGFPTFHFPTLDSLCFSAPPEDPKPRNPHPKP